MVEAAPPEAPENKSPASSGCRQILTEAPSILPFLLLLLLLFEVVQLLHASDVLLLQRLLRLPRVVDVSPVLPLDQILDITGLFVGVEVSVGVAVCFHGVHRGDAARSW